MSFLVRKPTQWSWSEKDQELKLRDSAKWVIVLLTLVLFVPSFIAFIINLWTGAVIESLLSGIVAVPCLIIWCVFGYSLSVQNHIHISEIEFAVVKNKESHQTVSLKLSNGRYRQLYFVIKFQHQEFLDFLNKNNIVIEERSRYWALPLNY